MWVVQIRSIDEDGVKVLLHEDEFASYADACRAAERWMGGPYDSERYEVTVNTEQALVRREMQDAGAS